MPIILREPLTVKSPVFFFLLLGLLGADACSANPGANSSAAPASLAAGQSSAAGSSAAAASSVPSGYINGKVSVSLTLPHADTNANAMSVYVWVTTPAGQYIDTIEKYTNYPMSSGANIFFHQPQIDNYPTNWLTAVKPTNLVWFLVTNAIISNNWTATNTIVDGISSATVPGTSYSGKHWDGMDYLGNPVPQGNYIVWVEISDRAVKSLPWLLSNQITLSNLPVTVNLTGTNTNVTAGSIVFATN